MEIVPTLGLRDHVIAEVPPLTVAANCWVFPAERETVAGATTTDKDEIEIVPGEPAADNVVAPGEVATILLS